MAQSQNTKISFKTTGISYLGLGGKVGKFLLGDKALEYYIQIPWESIKQIGANVSGKRISRHFEVFTDKGKFLFASKDAGTILKHARNHIGNEKVIKLPTLIQTIGQFIKNLFAKK